MEHYFESPLSVLCCVLPEDRESILDKMSHKQVEMCRKTMSFRRQVLVSEHFGWCCISLCSDVVGFDQLYPNWVDFNVWDEDMFRMYDLFLIAPKLTSDSLEIACGKMVIEVVS